MLVLTRRAGESIVIGDDVRVVVLDVRGDTIRLGIDAPRSVQVHRAEVYAEVHAQNASAAGSTDADLATAAATLAKLARPRPQRPAPAQQPPASAQQPPAPAQQPPAPAPDATDHPVPKPKPPARPTE